MIPKPLAVFIVCVVTVVWLANFAAQFLVPGYHVDGYVHGIFFSVVGGALVASRGTSPSSADTPSPPEKLEDGSQPPPPPVPPTRPGGAHRAQLALNNMLPWRGVFA